MLGVLAYLVQNLDPAAAQDRTSGISALYYGQNFEGLDLPFRAKKTAAQVARKVFGWAPGEELLL
jgi:hypothetical protein